MSLKEEQRVPSEGENKIDLFQKSEVRKVHHDGEWWLSSLISFALSLEHHAPVSTGAN